MKKYLLGVLLSTAISSGAVAQQSTIDNSVNSSAISDTKAALIALEAGDYQSASSLLNQASQIANQLNLKSISNNFVAAAPGFNISDARFALSNPELLTFEDFINANNVIEATAANQDGQEVTIRVITDEAAMAAFENITADTNKTKAKGVEVAQMRGEPALKTKGADGSLSVVIMSKEDHALIAVEGDSEANVMALIDAIEKDQ